MASQQATSIDCWFGAAFLDLCLSVPVSTGVIGRIHRLRSRFQTVSCPTNRLGEVLGLFWGPNPTDQHELATADLLSILLISSATTGQMVVVGAIHPHDTTVFFFLPAQPQSVAISYVGPWLLASMPFLMAWGLFRTGLLAHLPYYQSIVFQRMPTAGIALDNQQRILALNPVAEQLFQISPDKVEGQTLDQAFPLLDHPTKPLMLNHQPYSCSYTQLFDRGDQPTGYLIRIHPLPTPESAQQLLDDLGLSVNELKYDSSDGRSYSWNAYLGDLIFQVTMVGSLSITHVEAEIEMVDRKLQAISQRYPHRQLCAIIDIEQGFNLDRQARGVAINQWIKWGKDPNFGHMAVIQGRGIIKVILDTLQRLAPELKTSIHTNPENALAYLRQQQRQAVDKSKFLQLWHVQQETMLLGGQTLKVVRRPQWSYQSDTAKSQFYLIEGETLVCSISGRLEAKDVTRQIELSEELEEVNGYPFTFVISDLSQVEWIDRKGRSLAQNYVKHAPYHPDHHLMIFPRFLRGLAKF